MLAVVVLPTVVSDFAKLMLTFSAAVLLSYLTVPRIVPEPEGEVVKPFVVYALASELLELSLAEVVILSLRVVPPLRLSAGVAVNVVALSEAEGVADILMQVAKLSEES